MSSRAQAGVERPRDGGDQPVVMIAGEAAAKLKLSATPLSLVLQGGEVVYVRTGLWHEEDRARIQAALMTIQADSGPISRHNLE